jgi:hypothetical protein
MTAEPAAMGKLEQQAGAVLPEQLFPEHPMHRLQLRAEPVAEEERPPALRLAQAEQLQPISFLRRHYSLIHSCRDAAAVVAAVKVPQQEMELPALTVSPGLWAEPVEQPMELPAEHRAAVAEPVAVFFICT